MEVNWLFVQSDASRLPLADASVDLVFTSPPYLCARTYGINCQRECQEWIDWMLAVVTECCRVSKGLVLINCAGVTRDRCYRPGPEGLLYEWWKRGGQCWTPAYWNRVGIPGSGGKQWLRKDVEYVLAFKRDSEWLPWSDNTACGHLPKWAPGGDMSNRQVNGARVNQWGHPIDSGGTAGSIDDVTCASPRPSHRMTPWGPRPTKAGKRPDGSPNGNYFNGKGFPNARKVDQNNLLERGNEKGACVSPAPVLANPGNLIKVIVGGGVMGHPLAHLNEAPFPEKLVEFFVKSWCPPGGTVLDPFSGSGTTVAVAARLGRNGIGCDLRMNQCELGKRRVLSPMMKKVKKPRKSGEATLFGESCAA